MLLTVTVGLVAMTVWQALAAAVGHLEEHGRARTLERAASVFKAAFYAYLAHKAASIVNGSGKSAGDQQQETTSTLLASTGGRWFVALIGLAIAAVGVGLIWYGVTRRFEKHLKSGLMSGPDRRTARWLGVAGYTAKGAAYGTVGVLILLAAVRYEPGRSRGLDAALHTLAAQPAGDLILTAVALGLVAYGIFCFYQARYRKV